MFTNEILYLLSISYLFNTIHSYITYIEVKYPLKGERSPPGSPWPLPQKLIQSEKVFTIDVDNFDIVDLNNYKCDIIKKAIKRYEYIIFSPPVLTRNPDKLLLRNLFINVKHSDICDYPKLNDDESYKLIIKENDNQLEANAFLNSDTVWGALRGLETFSQLIYSLKNDKSYLINETDIHDWPRFTHRGLLLDTSRHYLPVNILLRNLDAMSYNKLNVFHWHIVDDQSFPLESKVFPNLTKLGAYSEHHVYKQSDIRRIIEEARLRGIRVIPEIDTPGHTQSFAKAFPDLLTTCYGDGVAYKSIDEKHAGSEILDPTKDFVYEFFNNFFKEIRNLFKDDYIHLGMDEVYYECWKSNPDIKNFMIKNNLSDYSSLEQYYVTKTLNNVKKLNYKYMIWQDPVDNGVQIAEDAVVQIWKDLDKAFNENVTATLNRNVKVILSSCWYINHISYGQDWKPFYECEPNKINELLKYEKNLIGGEACMWGEFVDATNILSRLWPRASAVAERLWSNSNSTSNTDNATFRLDEQRCRMIKRNIPAQPILNGFCEYDWDVHPIHIKNKIKTHDETTNYYLVMLTFISIFIMLTLIYKVFFRRS